MWWFISLDIWWLWIGVWKLIVSVLWIAITRFLVWAAVEITELWQSGIVQWMKKLARDTIWSAPIIPIPTPNGWTSVWIDKAFGLNGKTSAISDISEQFKKKYSNADNDALQSWLDPEWTAKRATENASNLKVTSYWDKLVSSTDLGKNWTTKEIEIGEWDNKQTVTFNSLDVSQKKEVIEKINNIAEKDKRIAFRDSQSIITFNDWEKDVTYEFDNNTNKYKLENG